MRAAEVEGSKEMLLAKLEARCKCSFQREPRSATLAVGASTQVDVVAVGTVHIAAMPTAESVYLLEKIRARKVRLPDHLLPVLVHAAYFGPSFARSR